MGLFRRKRKDDFLDLTGQFRKKQELQTNSNKLIGNEQSPQASGLGFLGDLAGAAKTVNNSEGYIDISDGIDEKRRRLTKRLMDMTEKIEELSNQIYHLQQRIEVVEKKFGVNRFD